MCNKKESLLGKTQKALNIGGQIPDPTKLAEQIVGRTIIACFCTGCGYYQGATKEGLGRLARIGGLVIPNSLEGRYIATEICNLCGDGFGGITIEEV